MNSAADIVARLADLHAQATVERSHYYVGACVRDAMAEIARLRAEVERLGGDHGRALSLIGRIEMMRPGTCAEARAHDAAGPRAGAGERRDG